MKPIEHFQYCPKCGAARQVIVPSPSFHCQQCDFLYYFNPAMAAAALVLDSSGHALFIRRAKDPGKGKLAIPGGFIDAGETAEQALKREVLEEVNVELASVEYLCSETNEYSYRGITYPVLDLFFTAHVQPQSAVRALDGVESFCWLDPAQVDPGEIAFPSMRRALTSFLRKATRFVPTGLVSWIVLLAWVWSMDPQTSAQSLELHPENPHYFQWRDKPAILITSGEHYGAVLNLDFNYTRYLDTLAADGLNLTRTFAGGAYFEPQGAFNIAQNTLAPEPGRFISPWARSDVPGYAHGGTKFDLARWDEAYFQRLRDFVRQASQRAIVVELNLFCPFYEESQWKLSPFNAANNVNGVGNIARTNVYTLDRHGGLLAIEERMVRKFVEELRDFDNVYYEICNEPYFGGVTLAWQQHIAALIQDAQRDQAHPKLISQNIANKSAKVEHPDPNVSIFNFHYAAPPDTVAMNAGLNKVLGDNETGFRGTNDIPYRTEAWEFLLAGGALYNNLDYSFTVGHEDGTFAYPATQPGGGNATFRQQLRILHDFLYSFDFIRMKPDSGCLRKQSPSSVAVWVLSEKARAYAIYIRDGKGHEPVTLEIDLPAGQYHAEWINTKNGDIENPEQFQHEGGSRRMDAPKFSEDIALRIQAKPASRPKPFQ
jgi:ADP-ribose pyrophosphatase YjhB (NUDIX family)